MNEEEIDIIELLTRVKNGNAPKRIEIENTEYYFNEKSTSIDLIYKMGTGCNALSGLI